MRVSSLLGLLRKDYGAPSNCLIQMLPIAEEIPRVEKTLKTNGGSQAGQS